MITTCGLKAGKTLNTVDIKRVVDPANSKTLTDEEKAILSTMKLQADFVLTTI